MKNTDKLSVEVEAAQVPSIVSEQFSLLAKLKENVGEASKKADSAMTAAKSAKDKSAGLFHKKEAIESLQAATADLADAQISTTQALEVSFEYQQKITEITKYLFALGVTNIAMNRSVVRELELKLNGASKEELDDFARQEVLNVVKQLKAQEDLMKKQNDLTEKVKSHESTLRFLERKDTEHDAREEEQDALLRRHSDKDAEHDRLIAGNRQKTIEHDKLLSEKGKKDKKQDDELARQAAADEELGRQIEAGVEKDAAQDKEIARQAAADEELGKRIDAGVEKDKVQDEQIAALVTKNDELVRQISQLVESNLDKESQIKELRNLCDDLALRISEVPSVIENSEKGILDILKEKASRKSVIISYLIGAAGLIAAVIQFLV